MARSMAGMYFAASLCSAIALIVPHGNQINEPFGWALALLGLATAPVVALAGARIRTWMIHVLAAAGVVFVTVGIHAGGHGRIAGSASVFYVWIAFYVVYFFSTRTAAAYVVLIAASYATVLYVDRAPAGPALWGGMTGTVVGTTIVMGSLVRRLRSLATTDALTGLPNRRGWEMALEQELARAHRRQSPLCVAIIDLDRFKQYNDEHGHLAGDRLLKTVVAVWLSRLRDSDLLARYGGDEFGIILPDCGAAKGREIVARLCAANPDGSGCSAGVALARPDDDAIRLTDRADRALYQAKAAGGNDAQVSVDDVAG